MHLEKKETGKHCLLLMSAYTTVHHMCHRRNSCLHATKKLIPVTQLTEIKDYMSNYVSIMTIAHQNRCNIRKLRKKLSGFILKNRK